MRWLIVMIMLSVFYTPVVMAQEATASPEASTTIEHCISAPSEPPKDWHFDGTLITYKNGNGVYGFRADFPSRYYIAFDNDTEYGRFGSLSPDGKWFADYIGRKEYAESWSFYSSYYVTAIHVVSTAPNGQSYTVPVELYGYDAEAHFSLPFWFDATHLAIPGDGHANSQWRVVNPFEKKIEDASKEQAKQFEASYVAHPFPTANYPEPLYSVNNPANGLVFRPKKLNGLTIQLKINDIQHQQIIDTCIRAHSYVVSPTGEQIAISLGDDNGFIYIVDLKDWALYRLDLAANTLAAWIVDN